MEGDVVWSACAMQPLSPPGLAEPFPVGGDSWPEVHIDVEANKRRENSWAGSSPGPTVRQCEAL